MLWPVMYSTIGNITFDCANARSQAMFICADPEGNEFCLEPLQVLRQPGVDLSNAVR
jgi:hypothetical protein